MVNLTELEKDVIRAIAENQYADAPDSQVWSWAIVWHTKIVTKKEVSGVVSSLVKKGLAVSEYYDEKDDTVRLTEQGVKEYHKIKEE